MTKRERGDFFAVDRWTWGRVCDLGRMNEAVGYLVAAQGTGADNRYTSWSVTAMQKYAGIGWERGKSALEGLIRAGFLRYIETSTKQKPRYELTPADEIARAEYERNLASLTSYERMVLQEVRNHERLSSLKAQQAVRRIAERGILQVQDTGDYVLAEPHLERDPIWLPSALVVGVKNPEDAPVRRLRISQDIWALRLLIDLYHAQHLADYGGINPAVLMQTYDRELIGEQGLYRVWAFRPGQQWVTWTGPLEAHRYRPKLGEEHPIWGSIGLLKRQGLLTFVPHLFEGDPTSSEAEVIHPCSGEPMEMEIGMAALRAGLALLPEFKRSKLDGSCLLAPIERGIPNVQMVGVARLRHRPHTSKTGAWYANLAATSRHWLKCYLALQNCNAENAPSTILSAS